MTTDDKIKDEKLQYDIKRKEGIIFDIASGYVNILQLKKYHLLSQSRMIVQVESTYSPVGKALEKQTKTNENKAKIN